MGFNVAFTTGNKREGRAVAKVSTPILPIADRHETGAEERAPLHPSYLPDDPNSMALARSSEYQAVRVLLWLTKSLTDSFPFVTNQEFRATRELPRASHEE